MVSRAVAKLVFLFVVVALAGCASTANIKPDTVVSSSSGIIVASVTSSGGGSVAYSYRKKGSTEARRLAGNDLSFNDKDLRDSSKYGQLVALELEPGMYELTGWSVYVGGYPSSTTFTLKKPVPIEFLVEPGVVTYLGNLHTGVVHGRNLFRIKIPVSARSDFADDGHRDIPNISVNFPGIASWPVRKSILDDRIWYAGANLD